MNMSEDSRTIVMDDIEPQYRYDDESNVLWIDTISWKFCADMKIMGVSHRICSKNTRYIKFPYIPHYFSLEIEKINPLTFAVELIRTKIIEDVVKDNNYYIQVSFTLVASTSARKVTYMYYDDDKAVVYFTLSEFQTLYYHNNTWMIKCALWMSENKSLDNDRSKEQERMWQKKLQGVRSSLLQKQMATIMGRETLNDLFTGRQDFRFAEVKSNYLIRSFRFKNKLLGDIERLKNQQEPQGSIQDLSVRELGKILGYIKCGKWVCITTEDCIELYRNAYYCGLSYLKMQCRNYLKKILTGIDIFIYALVVADILNDENLTDFALDWYLDNKQKVLRSFKWKKFKKDNYELSSGFMLLFQKWEADERDRELEDVQRSICIRY